MALKSEIGHHCCDHAGALKPAVFLPAFRNDCEQLIAVDHVAAFVHDQHTIGVTVERDPDIGAHLPHLAAQRIRRGRAAFLVDVETIGLDADRDHVGAQFP